MDGILLVDKPVGWTSHDVVAKIRSLIRDQTGQKIKVGHAGTLDPAATGLLIILIGSYTKRAAEFSKLDKTYDAELTLGATSTTGDKEGIITHTKTDEKRQKKMRSHFFLTEITEVLKTFEGEIWQKPHKYSAVKVGGQRAYKMARQGKEVKLEPRKVMIYELRIMNYEYPKLQIKTHVSSGTYIRSLAEDIGKKLGTGAYLSALRRSEVGKHRVEDAYDLQSIDKSAIIVSP